MSNVKFNQERRINMKRVDDRTPDEIKTHIWIVAGTDSFLSGWGEAKGGVSYAGWACKYNDRAY